MADTELLDFTEATAVDPADDFAYVVVDATGTPADQKMSLKTLRGFTVVYKSADENVSSSTTLQDDDALTFAVGANEIWVVEYHLLATSASATPDIKFDLSLPASATYTAGLQYAGSSDAALRMFGFSTSSPMNAASVDLPAGAIRYTQINATVDTAGTAGNCVLQWAQNVSNGTASTVKAGSYLKAFRVP